jgi:hypothetical protein
MLSACKCDADAAVEDGSAARRQAGGAPASTACPSAIVDGGAAGRHLGIE